MHGIECNWFVTVVVEGECSNYWKFGCNNSLKIWENIIRPHKLDSQFIVTTFHFFDEGGRSIFNIQYQYLDRGGGGGGGGTSIL